MKHIVTKLALIAIMLAIHLSVFAQGITLELRNVTVKTVIEVLQRDYGYSFVVGSDDINAQQIISVQGANMPINEAMKQILQGQNAVEFEIHDKTIIVRRRTAETAAPPPTTTSTSPLPPETTVATPATGTITRAASARIITVTGTITDSRGETLPGATVLVVETGLGTATDINGRYSITVSSDATLIFSFVGMRPVHMPVGNRSMIHVMLEDEATMMEQVVVTGFREISSEAYTGAATIITSDQLRMRPIGSIDEALRGLAPGVLSAGSGQPGEANEVRLRGFGSMTADNQPLYVVDGVVWDQMDETGNQFAPSNPLAALNPLDIASIILLKDAASAALYGSRGANGVIVITTHSGREGEKTNFTVNLQSGVAFMMDYPRLLNGRQHADLWVEGQMHRLVRDELARRDITGHLNLVDELKRLYADKDGYTFAGMNFNQWVMMARNDFNTVYAMPTGDGGFRNYDFFGADRDKLPSTDWFQETSRVAPFVQANISMRGGTNILRYFASMGYFNQQGTIINSQLQRYSMRVRLSSEADRQLIHWGINNTLSYTMQSGPSIGSFATPQYGAIVLPSVIPAFLEDGTYNFHIPNNLLNTTHNPVASARENINERPQTRGIVQGWVQANILPWLRFRTTNSMDYRLTRRREYFHSGFGTGLEVGGGQLTERDNHARRFTSTNLFTANPSWGRHRLTVVAGTELENLRTTFNEIQIANFSTNSHPTASTGSQMLHWAGGGTGHSQVSALSSADYSFHSRYFLSASYRMDASSRFHPDYRVGNFWSVSGAYRISNEKWFRDLVPRNLVNSLRLRASYGINGTVPRQLYQWRELYRSTVYTDQPGAHLSHPMTPNLTWEGNRIWNLGMDARLFGDRLRFNMEYFDRQSRDLLQNVRISSTTGFRSELMNTNAGINNRGLEFEVIGRRLERGKHSLEVRFNLATLKSVYYGLDVEELDSRNLQILANGQNVHAWWLYEFAGISPETGQRLYYNRIRDENGSIIGTEISAGTGGIWYSNVGQGVPKVSGGFTFDYSYGPWTITTLASYGLGHHIFDYMAVRHMNDGSNDRHAISIRQLDRWTPDNIHASSALRVNGGSSSTRCTRYLINGNYLKIRNIKLLYTLSNKTANAMHFSAASVFVQVENPFVFSHIPGYDPELSLSGYRNRDSYPFATTFTFGVNINF